MFLGRGEGGLSSLTEYKGGYGKLTASLQPMRQGVILRMLQSLNGGQFTLSTLLVTLKRQQVASKETFKFP